MSCERRRIYAKKRQNLPGLPWLPVVTEEPEAPSVYVQNAYANTPYPLLIMKKSWTRTVPYRVSTLYMLYVLSSSLNFNILEIIVAG